MSKKNIRYSRNKQIFNSTSLSNIKHFWIIALAITSLVLISGYIAYYFLQQNNVPRNIDISLQEVNRATSQHWEEYPKPELPKFSVKTPITPKFEKPPFELPDRINPQSKIARWIDKRFIKTVQTCPHRETREGILRLLKEKKIRFGLTDMSHKALFTFGYKENKISKTGVLLLDTRKLLDLSTPRKVMELWLIYIHEFQHIQDWLAIGADFEICSYIWKTEVKAHKKACWIALRWGISDLYMCDKILSPSAFKQQLFFTEKRKKHYSHCVYKWAKLAGHPRPESFK